MPNYRHLEVSTAELIDIPPGVLSPSPPVFRKEFLLQLLEQGSDAYLVFNQATEFADGHTGLFHRVAVA